MALAQPTSSDDFPVWVDPPGYSHHGSTPLPGGRDFDPTADESTFAAAELEFMEAMRQYKRSSNRMFPTWSETLEVLTGLGYRKPHQPG